MQVDCWKNQISMGVYSGTQLDSNRGLKIPGLRLSAIVIEICIALYSMNHILCIVFFVVYTMHKEMYSV